jgi:hypothetical protein
MFICPKILPHNIVSRQSLASYPILFTDSQQPRSLDTLSENLWVTTNPSQEPLLSFNNDSFKYVWSASNLSYLSPEIFSRCTAKRVINTMGSSHSRFLYDFLYHNYVNPDQYLHHAGDHRHSSVYAHKHLVFGRFIAEDGLDIMSCDQKMTLIIETGTWDLQFYPLANFIFNPKDGPKLIRSIYNLMQKPECRANVNLFITTCPPARICKDIDCGRQLNYWKNNAVIRAFNQFLITEIMKLNLSSSVKILDIIPIMLPRVLKWRNDLVSGDHYLFSGYDTTPHGIAMALEIMHHVCEDVITEVASSSAPNKTSILGFNQPEVLFSVSLSTPERNVSSHYYIWHINGGCYEEFPGKVALESYGYNVDQFTTMSAKTLKQYLPCRGAIPLNGVLWKMDGDGTVYFIDSGYRRPIFNMQSLYSLGRDFSEVRQVGLEKMLSLPIGETLYDRNGVNFMNHNRSAGTLSQ